MNLYLIRHADPDYASDSLTARGFEQAERLAEHLRDVPFTHVYCSPLGRAQRTMAPTARDRELTPVTLEWLREMRCDMGIGHASWNVTAAELAAEADLAGRVAGFMDPQVPEVLAGLDALLGAHGYRRAGPEFHCLDHADDADLCAVFAHAGLIMTLVAALFHLPLADFYAAVQYPPTGITHLRMVRNGGGAELRMLTFAARPHLGFLEEY